MIGTNTHISIDGAGTGGAFTPAIVLTFNSVVTDLDTLVVNRQRIV